MIKIGGTMTEEDIRKMNQENYAAQMESLGYHADGTPIEAPKIEHEGGGSMTNEEHVEEMLKTAMDNNLPRNDMWIICIMSITESLAVIADELEALRKGKEGSD